MIKNKLWKCIFT